MRCAEIMTSDVVTVGEDATVLTAARLMRGRNIGFLPVVNEGGEAVGTLTDRDLALRVVADDLTASTCRVREVMSREIVACRPEDDLGVARELMARYKKSRLVVLDEEDVPKGVISLSDIAERDELEQAALMLRAVASREANLS